VVKCYQDPFKKKILIDQKWVKYFHIDSIYEYVATKHFADNTRNVVITVVAA
jgi:hypothetical protein